MNGLPWNILDGCNDDVVVCIDEAICGMGVDSNEHSMSSVWLAYVVVADRSM